jgi:hypothetical protein
MDQECQMTNQSIFVRATWDEEAKVWVATSEDIPGLVTEAERIEDLPAKLNGIILDLYELNRDFELPNDASLRILSEQVVRFDPAKVA